MKQRTSQILFQYWNDVRGRRMAPERFDIEPSRIAAILPETCIIERGDESNLTFRLAGTRICDNYGRELRGIDLHDLASPADAIVIDELLLPVTRQGAVAVMELTAAADDGRTVTFEMIILPLLHLNGVVTRYLGALSPIDPPAWLGAEPLTPGVLTSHALVWPDGRPHALVEKADRPAPFIPAMTAARIVRVDRRQFRVLDGGKA